MRNVANTEKRFKESRDAERDTGVLTLKFINV